MDVNLSKDIKAKIVSEVATWIADTYSTTTMKVSDLALLQTKIEDITWTYVKDLKLRDPMNEQVCYLYLVGDVMATVAVAFLTHAAESLGITNTLAPPKETVAKTDLFSLAGTKKEVLN
jgi:hypothetical protein